MRGECFSTCASDSGRGKRKDGTRSAWGNVGKDICADAGLGMDDATIKRGAQLHSSRARKAPFAARAGEHEQFESRQYHGPVDCWPARDDRAGNKRGSTVEAGSSAVGSKVLLRSYEQ